MAVSKSTLVLLAGAGALVAGVLLMPRTPASAPQPPVSAEGVALADIGTDPVDIAVAKGKKLVDKRNTIKDRDQARDLDRRRG